MDRLKLIGMDAEDLDVISAHLQDAVVKVGDMEYARAPRQFAVAANRFVWETVSSKRQKTFERRRSVVHFDRVEAVRTFGIDRNRPDDVLSLLSIRYEAGKKTPEGEIELIFADDVSIVLSVECVEVQLADQGGAWETHLRPKHPSSA